MPDYNVIEETDTGWKQIVGAQVSYQDADGQFVSREEYVTERDAVLDGFGVGGYGR